MLRFLLIILVIAMVMVVFNRMKLSRISNSKESKKLSPAKMVKCASCELHVTLEDAQKYRGQYYCCPEHRNKAQTENQQ